MTIELTREEEEEEEDAASQQEKEKEKKEEEGKGKRKRKYVRKIKKIKEMKKGSRVDNGLTKAEVIALLCELCGPLPEDIESSAKFLNMSDRFTPSDIKTTCGLHYMIVPFLHSALEKHETLVEAAGFYLLPRALRNVRYLVVPVDSEASSTTLKDVLLDIETGIYTRAKDDGVVLKYLLENYLGYVEEDASQEDASQEEEEEMDIDIDIDIDMEDAPTPLLPSQEPLVPLSIPMEIEFTPGPVQQLALSDNLPSESPEHFLGPPLEITQSHEGFEWSAVFMEDPRWNLEGDFSFGR